LHASTFATMFKRSDNSPNQERVAILTHWLHSFDSLQTKLPKTMLVVETCFSQTKFLPLPTSLDHNSDSENSLGLFSMAFYPIHIADKYSHLANELEQYIPGMWIHLQTIFQIH